MTANSGPGYTRNPEHRVETRRVADRVVIVLGGEVIADTRAAIRLDESGYPPVYYVPRADANEQALERTSHRTHCPFKGYASYYSVKSGERIAVNAVWSYESPYDEVIEIKDYLAFYPDEVSITVSEGDAAQRIALSTDRRKR